jgi:hypothetical protein
MEGLDVEPGVHFLLAETVSEWVACVQRVRADAGLRERLARAGRELVEREYSLAAIRETVRSAYAWLPA